MADNRFMRHPGYNSYCWWNQTTTDTTTTDDIAMEDTNNDNDTSTVDNEMLISNNQDDDTANVNLGGAALISDESNRSSSEESLDDSVHSVASEVSFYEAVSTDLAAKARADTVEEMNKQAEEARHQLKQSSWGSPTDDIPRAKQNFLYSLYNILEIHHSLSRRRTTAKKLAVTWLPHGKGFIINDLKAFEEQILPSILPQTNYACFARKLKRWQFIR